MYTLNDISQIILIVNENGRVEQLNSTARATLGFGKKDIEELNLSTLFRETSSYVSRMIEQNGDNGHGELRCKATIYTWDGDQIEVTVYCMGVGLTPKKNLVFCVTDHVKKRSSCKEKVTSIEKSYEILKKDIKTKIFTGLTRSFRNLMGTVIGYSEMGNEILDKNHECKPILREILAAGTRGKSLLNRITALTMRSESHLVSLDPEQFFSTIIANSKDLFPHETAISVVNIGSIKSILVDPVRLEHSCLSVILNSIVSLPNGKGRVDISISKESVFIKEQSLEKPDKQKNIIVVSITDNGCGIDELERELFNRFKEPQLVASERIKTLQAIREINAAQGIDIYLPKGNNGSTIVELCFSVTGESVAKKPQCIETPKGNNELILVVDDEKSVADITERILIRLGYRVAKRTDSILAYDYFIENAEQIDLLITDQMMPKMSGLELIAKILPVRKDLPVIMLTGYSSGMTKENCTAHGVQELAMKPLDKRELAVIVYNALNNI